LLAAIRINGSLQCLQCTRWWRIATNRLDRDRVDNRVGLGIDRHDVGSLRGKDLATVWSYHKARGADRNCADHRLGVGPNYQYGIAVHNVEPPAVRTKRQAGGRAVNRDRGDHRAGQSIDHGYGVAGPDIDLAAVRATATAPVVGAPTGIAVPSVLVGVWITDTLLPLGM
jgi:hypothetical protein